jgi:AcrR family transcriptional regulator
VTIHDAIERATPASAFAAARRRLRAGGRLDMVALAKEVGVGRATLYRWAGDRDLLLADVIWAELDDLITFAAKNAKGRGARRLERAVETIMLALANAPMMQSFLANEGESGLRLATAPQGLLRPRLVARVAELIELEHDAGRYDPPAPPAVLADGIVALCERYLHNGGDPTLNPDPAMAKTIIGLLLREA